MKYRIALIILASVIFPAVLLAQSLSGISTNNFQTNDEVIISGQDLAGLQSTGFVCFNSNNACYSGNSAGIKSWTDTSIIFIVPTGIDFQGSVFVTDFHKGKIGQFNYTVSPTIFQKRYGNFLATQGEPGNTLTLDGDAFGDQQGSVKFGNSTATIKSWSNSEIDLVVPSPTEDAKDMKVCRNDGICTDIVFFTPKQIFNDPLAGQQSYLNAIKFNQVANLLDQQKEIVVAVIDNGVFAGQPDLQGRFWVNGDEKPGDGIDNDHNGYVDDYYGYNFVDKNVDLTPKGNHGTAIAGIIAANSNNQIGIVGLASKVKIMPLITCGPEECSSLTVEKAVHYAVDNGAQIINLSLAATQLQAYLQSYNDVFKYAYDHNVLVVVAAGNGDPDTDIGRNLDQNAESPVCNDAGVNAVIGVGATTDAGVRTTWTNYGSKCVDVYAPGEKVMTTDYLETADYAKQSGTSVSAPIISGLAARVWSAYPDMTAIQLRDFIIAAGNPMIDAQKLFTNVKNNFLAIPTAGSPPGIITPYQPYFSDVGPRYKNAAAITYLKEHDIIEGYTDGTFRPEQGVTRAELLKILINGGLGIRPDGQFQKDCFPDVKSTDWYAEYVCYAKDKGWAIGYADGTFRPNQNINKVEAIKLLVTINGLKQANLAFLPYADVPVGIWYEKYLKTAFQLMLLEETSNYYYPSDFMTRGSIAESIYRLLLLKAAGKI